MWCYAEMTGPINLQLGKIVAETGGKYYTKNGVCSFSDVATRGRNVKMRKQSLKRFLSESAEDNWLKFGVDDWTDV